MTFFGVEKLLLGNKLIDSNRHYIKFTTDLVLWCVAAIVAYYLRLDENTHRHLNEAFQYMLVGLPVKAMIIYYLGFHRQTWHKIGTVDLYDIIWGVAISMAILFGLRLLFINSIFIPFSIPIIEAGLAILMLSGIRLFTRIQDQQARRRSSGVKSKKERILVAGAGDSGSMIVREMLRHPEADLDPVCFTDDESSKLKKRILGVPVLGNMDDIPALVDEFEIDQIIIAMPSATGDEIRRVVEISRKTKLPFKTIPGMYDLISGNVTISQLREVKLEDLLRRKPVQLDMSKIREYIEHKVILVTGAGGSIGSEIVNQVIRFNPDSVVMIGRGENSMYDAEKSIRKMHPHIQLTCYIANVRDSNSLGRIFEKHRPDVVFHSAAHKHVPMMERNPEQAILNNVMGTKNVVELALKYESERLVNISTDKAVNPTSVMGASKRIAEKVVLWGAEQVCKDQEFVSVRFGNVLGSRGSVIPLFRQQIEDGGPVTVTHPDMERYFMTIPEASQLVLQAASLGPNGSTFVLDMGKPVKISDLARDLIKLSGLEPDKDIKIEYNGIRPGEKLYEELLTAEEGTDATLHKKIFKARSQTNEPEFRQVLDGLCEAAERGDTDEIRGLLKILIPTYQDFQPEKA